VARRQNGPRLEVEAMTHPGDEKIADRLTREQAAQKAICTEIMLRIRSAQDAAKLRR